MFQKNYFSHNYAIYKKFRSQTRILGFQQKIFSKKFPKNIRKKILQGGWEQLKETYKKLQNF